MSGIYIHIPFCKQACHYCNFHFSTSLKFKEDMIDSIIKEIELSKNYLKSSFLDSIYFGGGTPSLLSVKELERILIKLQIYYSWDTSVEFTLEANPDDLNKEKISGFTELGVNRWSLGIQSFLPEDLHFMNRSHDRSQAIKALTDLQNYGTKNITIDLIYGTPTLSDDQWIQNIEMAIEAGIPHLSCYALTVEEGTALAHFIKKGKTLPLDPEKARRHFDILMEKAREAGYIHYEISNFAFPDHEAVHNSNYWKGEPYVGIGPSAHSYNGTSRQWNIANNAYYRKAIQKGIIPFEIEHLSLIDKYNEYVMTGFRTIWGVDIGKLDNTQKSYFLSHISSFLEQGLVVEDSGVYILTQNGKHLADFIAMELFME
jgi:oxygen-independent coproporphyrinogen-3 oxidase